GCYEASCRIACTNNEDLYSETDSAMNGSNCEVFTSLIVVNQNGLTLQDKWIDSNATVLKIVLMESQFERIATGAFATAMFAKVFHMTWLDLKLKDLSNGALLGLYSLSKLEIDFQLPDISMTLLQPVQVTLTHLRINAGVTFQSNLNVFENIYLEKLNHLDLSHNFFSGPLSKRIFTGTPNVTYLLLKYCSITSIEDSAFEDLADKLILVDLKHNFLTQIGEKFLGIAGKRLLFDLEPNNWNCNCHLRSMVDFYNKNKGLFISIPYCRMPYNLYGKIFDDIDSEQLSCDADMELPDNFTADTTTEVTVADRVDDPVMLTDSTYSNQIATEAPTKQSPYGAILQFSCSEAIDYDTTPRQFAEQRSERSVKDATNKILYSGTFVFEPPIYDLILELFDNRSVRAYIEGYQKSDQYNIIWFSDQTEDSLIRNASQTDYICMQYEEPYLIVDPLQQNRTYTFCMMPIDNLVISPLLCQPLHVPLAKNTGDSDDVWIAESEKQFTIAMLCLIFFISTVFGAIFAYLGIKSFPNLLEGSKNVLVVKKVDKECYVSTIADSQYIKRPLSKSSSRNTKSFEASAKIYDTSLPSLCNLQSPSTCFEEPFTAMNFQTIGYEMPKQFKKVPSESCTVNKSMDRPGSPPPLPKRNSTVSDSYLGDKDAIAVPSPQPKCLKVQCRVICFNGRQSEISKDIKYALADDVSISKSKTENIIVNTCTNPSSIIFFQPQQEDCTIIDELHLYNYYFLNAVVPVGFLAGYTNKVRLIYIGISNITTIESGAFGGGIFYRIILEDLQLLQLDRAFFTNITSHFNGISIMQDKVPLQNVYPDFLDIVQSQIQYLRLRTGITCVRNLTATSPTLGKLSNADFSYNDFGHELLEDSFRKLTMVEKLILSNSKITYLPKYIFQEQYQNYLVDDERICFNIDEEVTIYSSTTTTPRTTTTSITTPKTTTDAIINIPTISTAGTVNPDEIVPIECAVTNYSKRQNIRWPQIDFIPRVFGALTVKISVDQRDSSSSFGVFWFSKTTKEYYMMELLPDEFGLGCYFTMPLQTIVTHLVPNVAYTFCLVDDNQNSVSPFSCKSVHIGSNLNTHYSAWLSRSMRAKGISAMVLGIVLFMFMGITSVFLVLKQKPMWLKGSKRVITPKFRPGEVIVMPRSDTAEYLKQKEDMISRMNTHRSISFASRKNSVESLASSDSYMETNLYEIIPTYISFDKVPQWDAPSHPGSEILDIYQPPLRFPDADAAETGSVRYAQITPRTKRISSDPLPAIPSDV
ncbi:hypothetical protein KR044_011440, partial [Drosophila immigrans]